MTIDELIKQEEQLVEKLLKVNDIHAVLFINQAQIFIKKLLIIKSSQSK